MGRTHRCFFHNRGSTGCEYATTQRVSRHRRVQIGLTACRCSMPWPQYLRFLLWTRQEGCCCVFRPLSVVARVSVLTCRTASAGAIGFAVPAAAMAVAIVTFLAGSSLYTHVEPTERCTSSLRSSARLSAAVQSISVRVWIWRKSGACLPCQRPTALVPTALPCVPVIPTWSSGRAAAPRFMSGALKTRGI